MLSRRYFMAAGTGTLASICLPFIAEAKPSSYSCKDGDIDPKIKAECDVFSDDQLVARLNMVGLSESYQPDARTKQFILNFESAQAVNLPEASYRVVHPVLGHLNLFLQPSGTLNVDQHDGQHYRACMAMLSKS